MELRYHISGNIFCGDRDPEPYWTIGQFENPSAQKSRCWELPIHRFPTSQSPSVPLQRVREVSIWSMASCRAMDRNSTKFYMEMIETPLFFHREYIDEWKSQSCDKTSHVLIQTLKPVITGLFHDIAHLSCRSYVIPCVMCAHCEQSHNWRNLTEPN